MVLPRALCLAFSLLFCGLTAAKADNLNWGMSANQCGNNGFSIVAGDGRDIYLTSISGTVTASVRTSLTNTEPQVLLSMAGLTPVRGKVVSNPTLVGYEHEVDQGLFVTDVKLVSSDTVQIPFKVRFPTPELLPRGVLETNFFIATYAPDGTQIDGPCLSAEAHVEFIWQYTP